jgi:signal peptidase I
LTFVQRDELNVWIPVVVASSVAIAVLFAALVNVGTPVVVLSGSSMVPALKPGDAALLYRPHIAELNINDLVAFRSGQTIVVHRVVEKGVDSGGSSYLVTKGDSNQWNDKERIDDSNYLGKVYQVVPKAGALISTLQNPVTLILLVITIAAYVTYRRRNSPDSRLVAASPKEL